MKNLKQSRGNTVIAIAIGASALYCLAPAAAQETISFPGRSSDLAHDSYWTVAEFSEGGGKILDLNVRRWDDGSWKEGTGSAQNSQSYDWNVPLYAPANGYVISCWRNFPDDPQPEVQPPNNGSIFAGGNHVVIITDDDNVISLNHLKSGTIPASLCPPNSGSAQFPYTTDGDGTWRDAAYVEPGDRVRVTEGQFIGRVGNSGASGGPHLHMSMQPIDGLTSAGRPGLDSPIPLRFRHGWGHRFEHDETLSSASWHRLRGEGLSGDPACSTYQPDSPECGYKHIHASPYLRRADAAAGDIKVGGDVLFLSANRAVTATVAENNNLLRLISWDLIGVDEWDRGGHIDGDAIKKVTLSEPASDYVLAAVQLANDNLKMVAYHVNAFGNFTEVDEYNAGEISELETVTVNGRTVTAVRMANGDMRLIAWDITWPGGVASVTRLGEKTTGEASHIAVAKSRAFSNGLYTALRNGNDELMVIPWTLSSDGMTFTRGGDVTSSLVGTEIAVAALAQGVAVALRDASGNLQVRTFSASGDDIGSQRDGWSAGEVSEIAMLTTPLGESNFTTIVKDSDDNVVLIGWAAEGDGDNLRRLGSSKTNGEGSGIAADSVYRSYPGLDPRDMIATLMAAEGGEFRLIAWDTNLVDP